MSLFLPHEKHLNSASVKNRNALPPIKRPFSCGRSSDFSSSPFLRYSNMGRSTTRTGEVRVFLSPFPLIRTWISVDHRLTHRCARACGTTMHQDVVPPLRLGTAVPCCHCTGHDESGQHPPSFISSSIEQRNHRFSKCLTRLSFMDLRLAGLSRMTADDKLPPPLNPRVNPTAPKHLPYSTSKQKYIGTVASSSLPSAPPIRAPRSTATVFVSH